MKQPRQIAIQLFALTASSAITCALLGLQFGLAQHYADAGQVQPTTASLPPTAQVAAASTLVAQQPAAATE